MSFPKVGDEVYYYHVNGGCYRAMLCEIRKRPYRGDDAIIEMIEMPPATYYLRRRVKMTSISLNAPTAPKAGADGEGDTA